MTRVLQTMIRSALEELADSEYQGRVWTGHESGGEMSFFVESVSRLFDDSRAARSARARYAC